MVEQGAPQVVEQRGAPATSGRRDHHDQHHDEHEHQHQIPSPQKENR
ncbi:hypothetical protein [uncultured Nocardioides sp.]|nr:hypothetical protein [uncultured Nocardioides sp.]